MTDDDGRLTPEQGRWLDYQQERKAAQRKAWAQRRQRARHEPGLSRRDERAAAVEPEGGARLSQDERAKRGPMEIAVRATWFSRLAHTPVCSSWSPARTPRDHRGRDQRIKTCLWRKHCNFRRFQTCRNLRLLPGFSATLPVPATPVESSSQG